MDTQTIVEKLRDLPPDKIIEVEDFIDFLRQRKQPTATERELVAETMQLSEAAFQSVWDNADDAVYDRL